MDGTCDQQLVLNCPPAEFMESPAWYLGTAPDETAFTGFAVIRYDKYQFGDGTCDLNIQYRTATTRAALSGETYQPYDGTSFTSLGWVQVRLDNTDGTSCCTIIVEDVTLEWCKWDNILRARMVNQGDEIDFYFRYNTCTLQIVEFQTIGNSSRNIRVNYKTNTIVMSDNQIVDVSSDDLFLTVVGLFDTPALVLEEDFSITFI